MRNNLYFLFLVLLIFSCNNKEDHNRLAKYAIDEAIKVSGGELYNAVQIEFDFRDKHYSSQRRDGAFKYIRITTDSLQEIKDIYSSHSEFIRQVNGEQVIIPDSLAQRIENSINSVNYFVLLPYGLNDSAVRKTYIGKATVKGNDYHKIQVNFSEEGGGDDFEDVYMHWIHTETFKLEYLAYSFHVNGGGMRFREAYNERYINGLRIVDYNNFKPKVATAKLEELDSHFEQGTLELLSKIETENVSVNSLQ